MNIITEELWGKAPSGKDTIRYTISGDRLCVSLINFGATVQRMTYDGNDIVFSLPNVEAYSKFSMGCIGATVGRYAGRIAEGKVNIDGVNCTLTRNHRGNHMHGGFHGFNTKVWKGRQLTCENGMGVQFSLLSPDVEEGYPGNLDVSVTFVVTCDDSLKISYYAKSDKNTIINLTNHSYFNLNYMRIGKSGFPESDGDNSDVELMINASHIAEQVNLLPTGRLLPVKGTPFDFRTPKIISRDMINSKETAKDGYDHFFVLSERKPGEPSVTAYCHRNGLFMECFTDRPGVQLFTMGNPGGAFALETQSFPDSPNHLNFPSAVLLRDEEFHSETTYKFSIK